MRAVMLLVLALASMAMSGCDVGAILYIFAPDDPPKKIKAEFAGLPGHSLAIVVHVDQRVTYEYPTARAWIAAQVAAELSSEQARKSLKDLKIIDPERVLSYQDEQIHWDEIDKTELGKVFDADYVLYLTVIEFTTREAGSVNLYRGTALAEASLYNTAKPERESRVWKCDDLSVTFPEKSEGGRPAANDSLIYAQTIRMLADQLAKKFYYHEVKADASK